MPEQRAASDPPSTLGGSLRALRKAAGMQQGELAAAAGMSQSQVSKVESDSRRLAPDDARRLAGILAASPAETDRLVSLAEDVSRQFTDSRSILSRGSYNMQVRIRQFEEGATLVRGYQPAMVMGQLQCESYTRAVFLAGRDAVDADRLTAERGRRARLLDDPVRRWDLIQTEGSLGWCLGGPAVMVDQLEHLIELHDRRPNVDLGIIPAFAPVSFTAGHGFQMYDSDAVHVGTRSGNTLVIDREGLVDYAGLHSRLGEIAVRGPAAREILSRVLREYQARV